MRARSRPPKQKHPAVKRIKLPPRPPCSRCGKHPAVTGRTVCVSCRDRVSNDHRPLPEQIIPIPYTRRRSYGEREDTNQTKYGGDE
jgi:hypothetical protein